MKSKVISMAFGLLVLAACADEHAARPPSTDEIPEWTSVSSASVSDGFWNGKIRTSVSVAAFQITKYPVTVARYRQCVAVGACAAPSLDTAACSPKNVGTLHGPTYTLADDLPLTCSTPSQARAYCAWQGGQLPTEAQWLRAVRGEAAQEYAWGAAPGGCEMHPEGYAGKGAPCGTAIADFVIGKHEKGASLSGVQDALLTPAELLRTDSRSGFGACRIGASCTISGLGGGSIDRVANVPDGKLTGAGELSIPTYGFRCVKGSAQ